MVAGPGLESVTAARRILGDAYRCRERRNARADTIQAWHSAPKPTQWARSKSMRAATGERRRSVHSRTSRSASNATAWRRAIIRALGILKKGAAQANAELGELPRDKADLIAKAADEVIAASCDEPLPAGRVPDRLRHAIEHERERGDLEPRDRDGRRRDGLEEADSPQRRRQPRPELERHVPDRDAHRRGRGAAPSSCTRAVSKLRDTLAAKAEEFKDIVKVGRTHLQDATPITLGQEIGGWVAQIDFALRRGRARRGAACTNSHRRHGGRHRAERAPEVRRPRRRELRDGDRLSVRVGAEQVRGALGATTRWSRRRALRTLSAALMKMANDVRWLASGPRNGIGEITSRRTSRAAHHAGQGEPDAVGSDDDGVRAGVRERRDGGVRGQPGQLPAQRVQAGDGPQRAREHPAARATPATRSTTTAPSASSRTARGSSRTWART